jgi:hypothetical protein
MPGARGKRCPFTSWKTSCGNRLSRPDGLLDVRMTESAVASITHVSPSRGRAGAPSTPKSTHVQPGFCSGRSRTNAGPGGRGGSNNASKTSHPRSGAITPVRIPILTTTACNVRHRRAHVRRRPAVCSMWPKASSEDRGNLTPKEDHQRLARYYWRPPAIHSVIDQNPTSSTVPDPEGSTVRPRRKRANQKKAPIGRC